MTSPGIVTFRPGKDHIIIETLLLLYLVNRKCSKLWQFLNRQPIQGSSWQKKILIHITDFLKTLHLPLP